MANRIRGGYVRTLLFASLLFGLGANVKAQTINAASCGSTDVQNALNSVAADGTYRKHPSRNVCVDCDCNL